VADLPINIVDLAVLAVLALSGVLALFRGFTHEALAVAGWVAAALATLRLFPILKPIARDYVAMTLIADAITAVAIFLVTLVVTTIIAHAISRRVRGSAINALDRSLGFVFGLVRGALIVSIAWLVVDWALPRDQQPDWLAESRSLPLAQYGGERLKALIPPETLGEAEDAAARAKRETREAAERARALRRLTAPFIGAPADEDSEKEKGYTKGERRTLERLLSDEQDKP